MAEEQKWQETGSLTPCATNCGFFGSPTTLNLCSKCYKNHGLNKDAQLAVEKTLAPAEILVLPPPRVKEEAAVVVVVRKETALVASTAAQPNRCSTCRRRVGITGFKCRCGITFCGTHRYPEQHGCTFDYKAMGREAIAKANPVIKAEKLDKI